MKLVGFGYSHIISIRFASAMLDLKKRGISIDTTLLSDPELPPILMPDASVNSRFTTEFSSYVERAIDGADIIFLCVAGNAHQIFGLVNHPIPFDFVLGSEPALPLHPQYEVVPSKLVTEGLINQGGFPETVWTLRAFKDFFKSTPVVQCALPPTIPSATHIQQNAGPFSQLIEQYGVAPALIRYKFWRLHSQLMESECNSLNIPYIPVPDSMIDDQGFLVQEAWSPDATHANKYYGTRLIEQLVQLKDPSFSLSEEK